MGSGGISYDIFKRGQEAKGETMKKLFFMGKILYSSDYESNTIKVVDEIRRGNSTYTSDNDLIDTFRELSGKKVKISITIIDEDKNEVYNE